jgi:arylsulfatase B|eukprot:SAG25_NODE_2076_length_1979_cov_1.628191_2_plen_136_part_00
MRGGGLRADDYGWADAGWHRIDDHDPSNDVMTPNMNTLVKEGIEMDRQYVYKYCSPTRSAIQSGRHPYHVNPLNADPSIYNPQDPVSGMAAIPRNMTGMAMKMQAGGYKTHMFGITIVSSAMRTWLWPDLNFALL